MNMVRAGLVAVLLSALCLPACNNKPDDKPQDGGGTPSPDMVSTSGCSEANLTACEYASRGLMFAERMGFATMEPQTGRTLPLVARIPAAAGPLPVVIWMHGGGFQVGGENMSKEWGETFARHGYVALHVGSSPLLDGNAKTYCELAKIPQGECMPGPDEDSSGILAIGRSYDLMAVLDDLGRLSDLSVKAGGPALDLARVAVAGWSGGARGPAMVLGARNLPTPMSPVFTNPHPRPVAAILMSPAGPTYGGWFETMADNSFKDMRGPTFTATGNNDVKPDKLDLVGTIRRRSYELQPADGKRFLLYSTLPVGVGGHGSFNLGDANSADPRLDRLSRAIASVARAFLDAHVRGDATAAAWLESSDARTLAGEADWQRK